MVGAFFITRVLQIRIPGDEQCQGGLAGAGGAVEDQGSGPSPEDRLPQGAAFPEALLLAEELLEAAGPHAVRQGRRGLVRSGRLEQAHSLCLRAS